MTVEQPEPLNDEAVLELFNRLPQLLDLRGGQVRITLRYHDSLLALTLERREFRIPAHRLSRLRAIVPSREVVIEARRLLEQIACVLDSAIGDTTIVAEYQDQRLRCIDLITTVELLPARWTAQPGSGMI